MTDRRPEGTVPPGRPGGRIREVVPPGQQGGRNRGVVPPGQQAGVTRAGTATQSPPDARRPSRPGRRSRPGWPSQPVKTPVRPASPPRPPGPGRSGRPAGTTGVDQTHAGTRTGRVRAPTGGSGRWSSSRRFSRFGAGGAESAGHAHRTSFVLLLLGLLGGGMVCLLVVNTTLAANSIQIRTCSRERERERASAGAGAAGGDCALGGAIQAEARKLGMRPDPHLVFLNLHSKRIEAQPGNRAMPGRGGEAPGQVAASGCAGPGQEGGRGKTRAGRDRAVSSGRGNGEDRSRRGGRPPASGQRRPGGPRPGGGPRPAGRSRWPGIAAGPAAGPAGPSLAVTRSRGRRDRGQADRSRCWDRRCWFSGTAPRVAPARLGDQPPAAGLGPRSGPGRRRRPSRELADRGVLAPARPGDQPRPAVRAAGPGGWRRCGGPARPVG